MVGERNMTEYRFIRPIDVLFVRGNRLFGGPGDYGESLMPPRPSLFAGALRSKMLAAHPQELAAFVEQCPLGDEALRMSLGSAQEPGDFRLSFVALAARGTDHIDWFLPLPADVIGTTQEEGENNTLKLNYLIPHPMDRRIQCATPLPSLPVCRSAKQTKPVAGLWLNAEGVSIYLNGEKLSNEHVVHTRQLWKKDSRLGIALSPTARAAEEGRIYTSDAVALASGGTDDRNGVGFLVGVQGAHGRLPENGLLRLGGDGRGAEMDSVALDLPKPTLDRIQEERRFRMVLTSPGLFQRGWLPDGCVEQDGAYCLQLPGFSARLIAASVPRGEIISGWDLLRRKPKPAQRVAPTGSVYWFDECEGDPGVLQKLVDTGLWPDEDTSIDRQRHAEGFNHVLIGCWAKKQEGV